MKIGPLEIRLHRDGNQQVETIYFETEGIKMGAYFPKEKFAVFRGTYRSSQPKEKFKEDIEKAIREEEQNSVRNAQKVFINYSKSKVSNLRKKISLYHELDDEIGLEINSIFLKIDREKN